MSGFATDASDLEQAGELLAAGADDVLGAVAEDLVPAMAEQVRGAVAAQAPALTGELRRRVRLVDEHAAGMGSRATVTVVGRVGPIVVHGSRAHSIDPRHGRALRFAGPPRGFASRVDHPGTRPDPFFARGVRAADIDHLAEAGADRAVAQLAELVEG